MKRLYKEGIFVTSRRSIYIQTKSDIIYSIQQRGIKGVKQSLSVLACCKPKGICSLAQIEKKSMENGFNQSSVWRMLAEMINTKILTPMPVPIVLEISFTAVRRC